MSLKTLRCALGSFIFIMNFGFTDKRDE